jgi:hypothetical protein
MASDTDALQFQKPFRIPPSAFIQVEQRILLISGQKVMLDEIADEDRTGSS